MKLEDIKTAYADLRNEELILRDSIKLHLFDELNGFDEDNTLEVDFTLENEMGKYEPDVNELFINDDDEIIIVIDNNEVKFDEISTSNLMDIIEKLDWIKNEK